MAIKNDFGTSRLQKYLIEELTVGSDRLDRVVFYQETKGMGDSELEALKERVRKRVMDFYTGLSQRHEPWHGFIAGDDGKVDLERTRRFVDKGLESWFRPWTRLAGRMDAELESAPCSEERLSSVCESFSAMPEYAPFLQREMKGYVHNRCVDMHLDYMKVSPGLRTPDLEKSFLENHPYLCEQKEWDLLGVAYKLGRPAIVKLEQEPSLANGYIGAETSFSRFLTIVGGPVFPQGKVTGLGQIDYKDCTNAFVLFDSEKKCVGFYDLSPVQRKMVLECVHRKDLALKHNAQEKSCEKGRKGGLIV